MNHGLFFLSFMDLLWYGVMEAEWDHERIEKLIMVTWPIWTNRNEVRNGGVRKGCRALYHGAMDYLGEYQASPVKLATSTPVLASHWTLPPHMRYKMNVDGAVFGPQKAANVGVLIRDAEGRVVGACHKKIEAPLGAVEVEAKAFEVGL